MRGSKCDFARAMSLAMAMEYPQLNRDRLIVPMSVHSDQLNADGTTQTVGVTVVLNLVGGRWQATGHQRLVGR